MKTKIIALEGTDGSGKETQAKMLVRYLQENNCTAKCLSFPMYTNKSSYFVKEYLNGSFGDLKSTKINPYGISLLFTIDRELSFCNDWKRYIGNIDYLIMDRYVESNFIYQGPKFKTYASLAKYISDMSNLEYNKLKLPRPDITFFLDMHPESSKFLRQNRKNKIDNSDIQDIHEKDDQYQKSVYDIALQICKIRNWEKVVCYQDDPFDPTNIKTPAQISEQIINILEKRMI